MHPASNRSNRKKKPLQYRRRVIVDSVFILISIALLVYIEVRSDAFEAFEEAFNGLGLGFELDELMIGLIFLGFGGLYFAWRRYRELHTESALREEAEAEASRLAYADPLTGLANRRAFQHRLAAACESAARSSSGFAVMMIDIDHFKHVNDLHGHEAGDQLLVSLANRLAGLISPDDMVARLGGDEFAIVARSATDNEHAARLAMKMLHEIAEPTAFGSIQIPTSASIGIAVFPSDGTDGMALLRRADIALFRAKQEGRGESRFFEPKMDQLIAHRATIEEALRGAIREDRIEVHFQPLLDLKTNRILGFEALARWTDLELGEIPPSTFIQVAEDSGLITPLSDQLLRKACRAAVQWPGHTMLSFNISAAQLRDRLLGLRILSILGESGLSPHRLEIEITEGTIVSEYETAEKALTDLRAAGVGVVLDDFGTGYSSLAQLTRFKFDRIKIDRSFVGNVFNEEQQLTLVRTIIGLARSLDITITAEGVEEGRQADLLREEGCDVGQGYLFGKAVPAERALELVRANAKGTARVA